jgi:hypothetical protein
MAKTTSKRKSESKDAILLPLGTKALYCGMRIDHLQARCRLARPSSEKHQSETIPIRPIQEMNLAVSFSFRSNLLRRDTLRKATPSHANQNPSRVRPGLTSTQRMKVEWKASTCICLFIACYTTGSVVAVSRVERSRAS